MREPRERRLAWWSPLAVIFVAALVVLVVYLSTTATDRAADSSSDALQPRPSGASAARVVTAEREEARVESSTAAGTPAVRGSALLLPGGWPAHVEGIEISFSGANSERAVVDARGAWSAKLAPGDWEVAAVVGGHALECRPTSITVLPDTTASYAFEIIPTPAFRGRLLQCDGGALSGVQLSMQHAKSLRSATDEQGLFVLGPVREGVRDRIVVEASSLPPGIEVPWWQWKDASPLGEPHVLEAGVGLAVPDFVLGPSVDLEGVAQGPDKQALAKASLSFRMRVSGAPHPVGANIVLSTDAAGSFRGRLPFGAYEVWCFPSMRSRSSVRPDPILLEPIGCGASSDFVRLSFDTGFGEHSLVGTAVDSRGEPLAGVLFTVAKVAAGMTYANRGYFPVKATMTSDADGALAVHDLPAGTYAVWRAAGGAFAPNPERVVIDAQGWLLLDTASPPASFRWVVDSFASASVHGLIVGAEPETVHSVVLTMDAWSRERSVLSDATGAFTFDGLPPGAATVTLPGIPQLAPLTVFVVEGARETLTIALPR